MRNRSDDGERRADGARWLTAIDKHGWGAGPWNDEPDIETWVTPSGLVGVANRNLMGAWCGYVGVPRDHGLYDIDYGQCPVAAAGGECRTVIENAKEDLSQLPDVVSKAVTYLKQKATREYDHCRHAPEVSLAETGHRGLTFSGEIWLRDELSSIELPTDMWWFGFDCAHAWDHQPGLTAQLHTVGASWVVKYRHEQAVATERACEETREHFTGEVYRTLPYVRGCVNDLAAALVAWRSGDVYRDES